MAKTLSTDAAFDRYEAIRDRFPLLKHKAASATNQQVDNLGAISSRYDVFVFDAFGVLNVGETPIAGARSRIDKLREEGKQVYVLTNAASYSPEQTQEKFRRLGFDFTPEELISSRAVCEAAMAKTYASSMHWGIIAPAHFDPSELAFSCECIGDDAARYAHVDGFVFLSSECWTGERHRMLLKALAEKSRPVVIANPDLVAPRETGLTLEPGYFAQELLDALPDLDMAFHGKPFPSVYDYLEHQLGVGVSPDRIIMMGDSLHTDILGAATRGWHSALITDHGFLKGKEVDRYIAKSNIAPNWIMPSI